MKWKTKVISGLEEGKLNFYSNVTWDEPFTDYSYAKICSNHAENMLNRNDDPKDVLEENILLKDELRKQHDLIEAYERMIASQHKKLEDYAKLISDFKDGIHHILHGGDSNDDAAVDRSNQL